VALWKVSVWPRWKVHVLTCCPFFFLIFYLFIYLFIFYLFEQKSSPGDSPSGAAQPEFSIDLNGAVLEHGEKASSRRNVFLLTTVLGLQVLLQCDSALQEDEWFIAIQKAIKDLVSKNSV
jgi:PH domain.